MSAQPDPMVTAPTFAVYRSPAHVAADPLPPPAPAAPPSFDHLFDERFAVRQPVGWWLGLAFAVIVNAALGWAILSGLYSGGTYWVVALAFVALVAPMSAALLIQAPQAIYAEPAGLRFVWVKRTAFYSWRSVKPWSLRKLLLGQWVLDINGGPYRAYNVLFFRIPRLYRVGQLLEGAHACGRDPTGSHR